MRTAALPACSAAIASLNGICAEALSAFRDWACNEFVAPCGRSKDLMMVNSGYHCCKAAMIGSISVRVTPGQCQCAARCFTLQGHEPVCSL